ncbi:MAG TPA: cation:proton antiporter [Candidatus Aquilonibacter sp.]|nr:cation:proton antiporter [Candidatus Aquilonibacter sp.]
MTTLELISVLVTIAAVFGWVSMRWMRFPITIGTMLLTVATSLALEAASAWTPGIHAWALRVVTQIDFPRLILDGMLPLLLFAGAFLLDIEELWRQRVVVVTLAVAGTVMTAAAVAALMFGALRLLGMNSAWLPCMMFGALISPTDPIAVLEMLRRVGISARLQAQLAGESLFNDGIGAVLFLMLLDVAHGGSAAPGRVAWMLLLEVGGAAVVGVAAAWVTSWLMREVDGYQVEILLTLALALGGYTLAGGLRLSAPLEAVIAGLALRSFNTRRRARRHIAFDRIERFWTAIDELQNAVLFVLLGLEVLAIPLGRAAIGSGAIAVVVALGVRLAMVAALLLILRVCRQRFRSSVVVLTWGGLHGGLSLALALSLPVMPKSAWVLPATYLVVLFSVVVQGGSMPILLRRFASEHPRTAQEAEPAS